MVHRVQLSAAYFEESARCVTRWLESSASMRALVPELSTVDTASPAFKAEAHCAAFAHGMRALEGLNDHSLEEEFRAGAISVAILGGMSRRRLETYLALADDSPTDEVSVARLLEEVYGRTGASVPRLDRSRALVWTGICTFFHAEAILAWRNVQDEAFAATPEPAHLTENTASPNESGIRWWVWLLGAWLVWALFF